MFEPVLDRKGRWPKAPMMSLGRKRAVFALLLTAAAPVASEVQHVPPEQAVPILGHPVTDADGKELGHLVDVLVDEQGQPQAAVIDFGGFMGVGDRKIAVEWAALHFAPADPKRTITLVLTPDQIKAAPEYKNITKPAPVVVSSPPVVVSSPAESAPTPPTPEPTRQ
jgi:PRC-barrel domain